MTTKKKKPKPFVGWAVILPNGEFFPAVWEQKHEVESYGGKEQVVRVQVKLVE